MMNNGTAFFFRKDTDAAGGREGSWFCEAGRRCHPKGCQNMNALPAAARPTLVPTSDS